MEYSGTYRRPYTGAHHAADQDVAQAVLVFHEFHTPNVLSRDGLSNCVVLVQNRGFGETHKDSGMLLRVHFDNLNLLPRM